MVNFKKLSASFKHAFFGIKITFREEQPFRIMLFIAVLVTIAMFYLELPTTQKAVLFLVIILVLALEIMNSVIEKFLNFIHPDGSSHVKTIKDIFAGIVLIASIGAAIIGILLFWPHILR